MSSGEIDGDANDAGNDDGDGDAAVVSESINPEFSTKIKFGCMRHANCCVNWEKNDKDDAEHRRKWSGKEKNKHLLPHDRRNLLKPRASNNAAHQKVNCSLPMNVVY